MTRDVLIIIVTYNGESWIQACIESLIEEADSDIFVVDCNSTDRSKSILESYGDKLITYFSKQNLGFGKANNIGLRYALENDYKYVFLVNQDTICEPGIVSNLIIKHQIYPEYGILSPMHFFDDQTLDSRFESYLKKSTTKTFTLFLQNQKVIPVDFVNAAFWFIPIETIIIIGGFDPIFEHYGEDNDFANRVIHGGKKIGVVPDIKVYHLRNQNENKPIKSSDLSKKYYNKYLISMKRPDRSAFKVTAFLQVMFLKHIVINMLKGEPQQLLAAVKSYIKISYKIPLIYEHRKIYTLNKKNKTSNLYVPK